MVVLFVVFGVKITAELIAFTAATTAVAYEYYKNQPERYEKIRLPEVPEHDYDKGKRSQTSKENKQKEPCTCRQIKLNVLYVNMRSMNTSNSSQKITNKLAKFKKQIKDKEPDIIAIAETWLTPKVSDEQIRKSLGIDGLFHLHRQDRADSHQNAYSDKDSMMKGKRGGGLLIITKMGSVTAIRDDNEELSDYIMTLQIDRWANDKQCLQCNKYQTTPIAFSLIYQRPLQSNERKDKGHVEEANKVFDRITRLPYAHEEEFVGWCLVGDFNMINTDAKNMKEGMTQLTKDIEFVTMSEEATHQSGNALDWVVASPGLVVGQAEVLNPAISDHHSLFYQMQLGIVKRSIRKKIMCQREECVCLDDI